MNVLKKIFFPDRNKQLAQRKFRKAVRGLGPKDVAIDCGANIGDFTAKMAARGARVHAFEPNPYAYAELEKRFAHSPNVVLYPCAVGASAGKVELHLHKQHEEDPVKWSVGSSLFPEKGNVSEQDTLVVDQIDLPAFIMELACPIGLLKIDIEGAEVALLHKLISDGLIADIQSVFVEMHDDKIPSLVEGSAELRKRLIDGELSNVDLHWK